MIYLDIDQEYIDDPDSEIAGLTLLGELLDQWASAVSHKQIATVPRTWEDAKKQMAIKELGEIVLIKGQWTELMEHLITAQISDDWTGKERLKYMLDFIRAYGYEIEVNIIP